MASNTLNNRSSGQTITDEFFNSIHQALDGDFVGRNATGVPTSGQNLGTVAIPWGTVRASSMIVNGNAVDPTLISTPQNIVKSGKTRATSNQGAFLIPNGAALSFIVDGTPTNLAFDVNGTEVTVITDITKTGITAAPSVNNTALVNDAAAADQFDTKFWGSIEHRKSITIDTAGTEITALVGKWAAFKIAGVTDEYFFAFVESATQLTNCYRGFFYDSASAPVKATGFTDNDTISLMKLGWVFIETDATTVDVTYTNPTWSFTSPGSPATGDYWYDLANNTWKRYDGASFVIINRSLVGMIVADTTAVVAARCIEFYSNFQAMNGVQVERSTSEIVRIKNGQCDISVYGNLFRFGPFKQTWNITTDLASAADMFDATEQASRFYYCYLTDTGETVISDIPPYLRPDMKGKYHPHNPWRAVGCFFNDSSSDIAGASSEAVGHSDAEFKAYGPNGYGSTNTNVRRLSTVVKNTGGAWSYVDSATLGTRFVIEIAGLYSLMSLAKCGGTPTGHGVSVNGDGTVAISGFFAGAQEGVYFESSTNLIQGYAATARLKKGDVVLLHGDTAALTDSIMEVKKLDDTNTSGV